MKVLMVSDMIMHGGAIHTRFLSNALIKRDVGVEIFSYSNASTPGIKTMSSRSVSLPFFFYKICINKGGFFNVLNESKPDVVHMHHCAGNLELSIQKIKSMGLNVVGTVHISPYGTNLMDKLTNFYFKKFLGKQLRRADKVIAVSRFIEKKLNQVDIKNTVTIPNGVDPKVFFHVNNARKKIGMSEDDFVLLYVGRLSPEKGIKMLLKTFKKLEIKNKKLYIIGSGPLKSFCKMYSKLNRDVVFLGRIREEYLRLYYSAVDLTVVPSLWNEAFGMVLIESMICGTPPVASAMGAIPEIVRDGYNGFLVNNITPAGFAKIIEESRAPSPKMRKSGIDFVKKNYTWDKVAENTKKLYQSLVTS